MRDILFTSGNHFYVAKDFEVKEYDSLKIKKYLDNARSIENRNRWKTSGAGAKFLGTYAPDRSETDPEDTKEVKINGASVCGDELIYSATLGDVGGLYRKSLEDSDDEGHIFCSTSIEINRISSQGTSCAASLGNMYERHIAVIDHASGNYFEITEGDVLEDYPSYSSDGSRIYFSSAGLAITPQGVYSGTGPFGIMCYDNNLGSLNELYASDKFSYILPKEDAGGNLLFIKKPYRQTENSGNIFLDMLLFPVRIIKAIGGLLNFFSIAFGGESLHSGKMGRDVKTKQIDQKELFFDGNVINAQQTEKENSRGGEKFPGIIPRSWELVRCEKDGTLSCIKKGVMDYAVCSNGDIVYSNGSAVIRLTADGKEHLVEKARLASNLSEL